MVPVYLGSMPKHSELVNVRETYAGEVVGRSK